MVDINKIDDFFNGKRPFFEKKENRQSPKIKFLRTVKLVMPSVAAIIIGFIVVFPSLKNETSIAKDDITIPKEGELEKLHIENTVFSITNEENQVSQFTADSLDEVEPQSKLVKIVNPRGSLPANKKGEVIDFIAKTGYYNQNKAHIKVQNDVKAVYSDGSTVITQSAEFDFNKHLGSGNDDIYAHGTWGKLWSQAFEYHQKDELLILFGSSKIISENNILTADKQIKYYRLENRVEAIGNVKIITNGNVLTADKMDTLLSSDDDLDIKSVEAFGNVKIITNEAIAKSDYAIYNPKTQQIELKNNVSITKDGNIIYGQKAITNLQTSISKVVSDPKGNKRVSGVIKGSAIKGKDNENK